MEDDGDIIKKIVEPTPGAKEGIRVRYIQFADSMYNAPAQPYDRARTYMWRYRGVDTGPYEYLVGSGSVIYDGFAGDSVK